jgi:hypothetical protein
VERMKDRAGKAIAINVLTPLPWWKAWITRLVFWLVGRITALQGTLKALSFIHFARWTIVRSKDLYPVKDSHGRDVWGTYYLLFNSNFNGPWEEYIDAFSYVLPKGLDLLWFTSTGYPGASPITPFKRYIRRCEFKTDAYWSAYPAASTKDIRTALDVAEEMEALADRIEGLGDDEFAREYDEMMWRVQAKLGSARTGGAAAFTGDVSARGVVAPDGA